MPLILTVAFTTWAETGPAQRRQNTNRSHMQCFLIRFLMFKSSEEAEYFVASYSEPKTELGIQREKSG